MFNAKPVGGTAVSNVAMGHKAQRSLNMLKHWAILTWPSSRIQELFFCWRTACSESAVIWFRLYTQTPQSRDPPPTCSCLTECPQRPHCVTASLLEKKLNNTASEKENPIGLSRLISPWNDKVPDSPEYLISQQGINLKWFLMFACGGTHGLNQAVLALHLKMCCALKLAAFDSVVILPVPSCRKCSALTTNSELCWCEHVQLHHAGCSLRTDLEIWPLVGFSYIC